MVTRYVPDAGDIAWLNFDPQAGREQAKRRPALVLSPATYNGKTGMIVCCPLTSQIKGYPFEVVITQRPHRLAAWKTTPPMRNRVQPSSA